MHKTAVYCQPAIGLVKVAACIKCAWTVEEEVWYTSIPSGHSAVVHGESKKHEQLEARVRAELEQSQRIIV